MEDATFNKLVEEVQKQLTSIHENVEQFDEDSNDATASIGQEITDLGDDIKNLLKQAQANITRLENNAGHLGGRQQKQQLTQSRLKQIKQFYKKEIDRFTQLCKTLESKLQQKRKTMSNQGKWNEPKEEPVDQLQEQLMSEKYDLDNQLIKEREQDIQKIDREAQLLNKLVGDLAIETHKADEVLDIIDTHQNDAKENIMKANVELDQAQDSQKSANKKYIVLAIIAVIIVAVLVIVLVMKNK